MHKPLPVFIGLETLGSHTGLETPKGAEGAPKKTKGDEIRHLSTVRGRTYRYTTLSIQKRIGKGGGVLKNPKYKNVTLR